jgi:hypothetical protein
MTMTVFRCSGATCRRMISLSAIPGGNPVARRDPEGFATTFQACTNCRRLFCDRCARASRRWYRGPQCPECGHPLADPETSRHQALRGQSGPAAAAARTASPGAAAPPSGAPRARSELEAGYYTALHPCPCGAGGAGDWCTCAVDVDGGLGLERTSTCRSCGRHRRFAFRGPVLPITNRMSFGPGTSDLIDAAEWLAVAEMAFSSGDDPAVDPALGRVASRGLAAAAVREALAFIPPGHDSVPDDAFWSEHARVMRVADPDRYTRASLHALLRGYDPTAAPPPPAAPAPAAPAPAPAAPAPAPGVPDAAPRPPASPARPLRLDVPGRCPTGCFAPDGSALSVASGFTRADNQSCGEVAVFATATGRCVQRHRFDAYDVRLVHTADGVIVADWQDGGGAPEPGVLARYTGAGREVLLTDVGIGAMAQTPDGFAALTLQGDLVVGAGDDLRVLPPVGPAACLAADPVGGRLAVGGDRLVLTDPLGTVLAVGAVPNPLHHVAFLGPDRIVTADPVYVRLWRVDRDALRVVAETPAVPGLASLAALPARNLVASTDRTSAVWAAAVDADVFRVVALPAGLRGRLIWASATGDLVALPAGTDERPPPAPEAVEVHDTRAWAVRPVDRHVEEETR